MATTKESLSELMNRMESFISTKTVIGEPVKMEDMVILPLVDVSLGIGATASDREKSGAVGAGMGAKMSPSAVLVVKDGSVRMVSIKNQDTVTKILDMVPDLVDKFTGKHKEDDAKAVAAAKNQAEERNETDGSVQ